MGIIGLFESAVITIIISLIIEPVPSRTPHKKKPIVFLLPWIITTVILLFMSKLLWELNRLKQLYSMQLSICFMLSSLLLHSQNLQKLVKVFRPLSNPKVLQDGICLLCCLQQLLNYLLFR